MRKYRYDIIRTTVLNVLLDDSYQRINDRNIRHAVKMLAN